MKILYVHSGYFPSKRTNSLQVAKMCEGYRLNGHDCYLMCGFCRKGFERYYDIKIPYSKISIRALSPMVFMIKFLLHILKEDYDVIHTRERSILYVASFVKFVFKKKFKVVYEVHIPFPSYIERLFNKFFIPDLFIFLTPYTKQHYLRYYNVKPYARYVVLYDASDGVIYPRKGILQDLSKTYKKVIMYVGSLRKDKGYGVIEKVSTKFSDYLFVFVGANQRELFVVEGNRLYIKKLPYFLVKRVLAEGDVFVLPLSYDPKYKRVNAFYTSPMKLYDYLFYEKPVVVALTPTLYYELSHYNFDHVFYYLPENVESFAEAISDAISHKDKIKKKQYFTWKDRANLILKKLFFEQ